MTAFIYTIIKLWLPTIAGVLFAELNCFLIQRPNEKLDRHFTVCVSITLNAISIKVYSNIPVTTMRLKQITNAHEYHYFTSGLYTEKCTIAPLTQKLK